MDEYSYHLSQELRAGRLTRKDFLRRATVAGVALSSMGAILTACGEDEPAEPEGAGATGKPQRGGTLTLGMEEPPAAPDPVTGYAGAMYLIPQLAMEHLVWPRPDYALAPQLATEWSADAPDTWTFHLRDGVTWHGGSRLTADDVVYTFDLLTDPEEASAALSAYEGVLSPGNTEKVDDLTVRFHLDRGYVDFPYLLSGFTFNSMILPDGYEIGQFLDGRVGTGPFILDSYTPERATLVRNPDYWNNGLPYLDSLEVVFRTHTAIAAGLRSGEIDVYGHAVPPSIYPTLSDVDGVEIVESPSSSYRAVHMRVDEEPFSDVRVRQAIASCLDRESIIAGVVNGFASIGNDHGFSPVFPLSERVVGEVPQRTQDIELARQLLAEAGFNDGLSVEFIVGDLQEIPELGVTIKDQVRQAGIEANLEIMTSEAYFGSGDNQPWLQVPFGAVDWNARGTPSQLIAPAYLCGAVWNSAHWCSDQFDSLMRDLDKELDEQRRTQLAVDAARLMHEEVPALIAYWNTDLQAMRSRVHDMAPGPVPLLDLRAAWVSA